MKLDYKKNLIIIIIALVFIIITLIILNLKGVDKIQRAQISIDSVEKKLQNTEKQIKAPVKLSKSYVKEFVITDNILFYEGESGSIYESNFNGENIKKIAQIENNSEIIFSPNGKELIIKTRGTDEQKNIYFNIQNNEKREIHKNIKNVVFSPNSQKIMYHFYDPEKNDGNISIANPDGSDFLNIFKTRIENINLFWPNNNIVSFYPRNDKNQGADLFILESDGKKLRKILKSILIQGINWSKNGNNFLISFKEKTSGNLKLFWVDIFGKAIDTKLDIPANQCSWSVDNSNIFCAKNKEIFRLNLETREKNTIISNLNFQPIELKLSPLENFLIFINSDDGNLYSLMI